MEFFSAWWDVLLFILCSTILIFVNIRSWRSKKSDLVLQDLPQKQFGATILTSASTAAISVVSILISASILYVQFELKLGNHVRHEVLSHTFRVIVWFLISLLMGLFLTWVHGMHGQFKNAATNLYITIPFGLQFIALAVGAAHVLVGIYAAIYK